MRQKTTNSKKTQFYFTDNVLFNKINVIILYYLLYIYNLCYIFAV